MKAIGQTLWGLKFWAISILIVWLSNSYFQNSMDPYLYKIVFTAGIYIILAVGLNLINGHTGQFSMGHAGFMAVGAYVSAVFTMQFESQLTDPTSMISAALFFTALILGGLAAALVGLVVGLPSLRLRGDYLAIVTLGFGEIIRVILLNIEAVGGARGLSGIPYLSQFGWVYTFAIVTVFVCHRLVTSSYGRSFLSLREDEIAAEAVGVPTTKTKVKAFMIGAFFAGIAGGLFAHDLLVINPPTFDFNLSFEIIMMVVLGGMGSISGSVIAAVILVGMKEGLRTLQDLTGVDIRMIVYSFLLIVLMLTRPNGLLGKREIGDWLGSLRKRTNS